jgi:hypothetical protein
MHRKLRAFLLLVPAVIVCLANSRLLSLNLEREKAGLKGR